MLFCRSLQATKYISVGSGFVGDVSISTIAVKDKVRRQYSHRIMAYFHLFCMYIIRMIMLIIAEWTPYNLIDDITIIVQIFQIHQGCFTCIGRLISQIPQSIIQICAQFLLQHGALCAIGQVLCGMCATMQYCSCTLNTSTVYWCIASKLKVRLIFNGMNKTFLWVDLSLFSQLLL